MSLTRVDLSGKRVLVTGATGFIGGRLIKRLVMDCKADVRAYVRNYGRASRIARFPIEMIQGDITDSLKVTEAAAGCDIMFHCVAGVEGDEKRQYQVNCGGTEAVLKAAVSTGCQRFVHISTIMVYGQAKDGDLDETSPLVYNGDVYSDSKVDAEKLVFKYHHDHGLATSAIQPTIVYGPYGTTWTMRIINEVKSGRVILVDGGQGFCNAVYVDDVVSAMLLAATKKEAVGEAFLISAENPIPWKAFYQGFENMLDCVGTVQLTMTQAEEIFNDIIRKPSFLSESMNIFRQETWRLRNTIEVQATLSAVKKVVPERVRLALRRRLLNSNGHTDAVTSQAGKKEKPIHPAHPSGLRFQAAKTRVRIDKAKRLLGYQPAFDFQEGMARTEAWARWAGLVEADNGKIR